MSNGFISLDTLLTGKYTLNQVDSFYRHAMITQDTWEDYCYLWRNSTNRLSSELIGYEDNSYPHTLDNALVALAKTK